jgi:hypothetical protein
MYQRTAHRITSAVNCRPLNGLFLRRITLPPQLLKRPRFYPIMVGRPTLQQNPVTHQISVLPSMSRKVSSSVR